MHANPETSASITVEGCPLHYTTVGQGPPVLWIQGVGVHGPGWAPQVAACAQRFTCITFDNRGLGRSVPRGAAITVERMVDDALAVLGAVTGSRNRDTSDGRGVSVDGGAVHVVGHSLGGLVAVLLALREPTRVRSLALLCTFASGRSAAPLTARMAWMGLRSQVGTRRLRRRGFLALVRPPGARGDADAEASRLAALFGHDLADTPPAAREQLRAMRHADAAPRLGELAGVPTLVVSARHDPIAPPRVGRALLGIPGARFVEVDDASHGLPLTHVARANELLLEHLAASESARGARPHSSRQ